MGSDFIFQAQVELDTYRSRLKTLQEKAEQASGSIKRQYFEEIQGIESKCNEIDMAIKTCKFAPAEEQPTLREKLAHALGDLRESVNKLTDKLK